MAEIIKCYRQKLPAAKFVGREYTENDKVDGGFSHLWEEWFSDGLFEPLESQAKGFYEDADAYCGLCGFGGGPMKYWIGMFLPMDAAVPEGYNSMEFEETELGVFWIYGKEPDVYMVETTGRLAENGFELKADRDGIFWMAERYVCPRYTEPDEKGNIILDHCYFLK